MTAAVEAEAPTSDGVRESMLLRARRAVRGRWSSQPVWVQCGWAMVLVRIALRVWVSLGAYFHMDDWFYLVDSQHRSFGSFVTQVYNGHLMPFEFALVWVQQRLFPANWGVAALIIIVLDTVGVLLLFALLRRAFVPTPWLLVPLAVGLFAPMWVSTGVWYASALQIVPLTAAMYATVHYLVRHFQTDRVRWLMVSLLAYVIGLLFWEKSLLIVVVVGFVCLAYFADGSLLHRLRRRAGVLACFVAVSGGYLALYLGRVNGTPPLTDRPSLSDVGSVAYTSVVEVLVPSLAGGPWSTPPAGLVGPGVPPSWFVCIALLEAALAVVVLSILRRGSRAAWAWVMLITYVALDVVLLALGRFDYFGSLLARDPRYIEDAFPVFTIALALAFVPVAWFGTIPSRPDRAIGSRWTRSRGAMAVAVVILLNSYLFTTAITADSWRASAGKSFWTTYERDASALGPVSAIDRKVPDSVMAGLFLDRAQASYIAQAFPLPVSWNVPAEKLYVLTDQGNLREAALASPVVSAVGPDGPCGWGVKSESRSIPLTNTLFEWDWVVRLHYLASGDTVVPVSMGDATVRVPLLKGPHEVWFVLKGQGRTLTVGAPSAEQGVCIAGAAVGIATPKPPG